MFGSVRTYELSEDEKLQLDKAIGKIDSLEEYKNRYSEECVYQRAFNNDYTNEQVK